MNNSLDTPDACGGHNDVPISQNKRISTRIAGDFWGTGLSFVVNAFKSGKGSHHIKICESLEIF